jgi:hypothetical protein
VDTAPTFVPGLELCGRFYRELVRPILDVHFPGLPHTAALIGDGSEVLGFDDAVSVDHHWGPRLLLFLRDAEHVQLADAVRDTLARTLPYTFLGYPTNFGEPDPLDNGTQLLAAIESGHVNHGVTVTTVRGFFRHHLGIDIDAALCPADWLSFAEQRLLTATTGAVYHDEVGLEPVRARFAAYPRDVWLYLMAVDWQRISQEEHLMGRAGSTGDEIGSALIGARLVRDLMHLCFLMERTYAPYPKWFGRAFGRLACGPSLAPHLQGALTAERWELREAHLVRAYKHVAKLHNALGVTAPMPEEACSFFGRPFQVMARHGFSGALLAEIRDPEVQRIARLPLIGSLDQFSDSTDLLSCPVWHPRVRQLYG